MKSEGRTRALGWLLVLLPPLLWAGNFVAGRAVRDDVPPMTLAFARHLLALLCFLPFAWGALQRDFRRYWALRWHVAGTAITGMAVFNLLAYIGLHSTTASNAQLLNSTIPVMIVLIGALFLRQRLQERQVFGLALSCAGVLVIILHGEPSRLLRLQFSQGDLLVFAGMASFALFSVWLRRIPADLNRVGLMGAQLAVAVLFLLPFFAWEWFSGAHANWNGTAMAAVLYVGIAASLLANLMYMLGVARVGPAKAGFSIHLIPLYGALLSSVLLGESLHSYHALGMAAIIGGLLLSRMGDGLARQKSGSPPQLRAEPYAR
jgi:drug/metabolite transporter (DMT)-like permease